MSIIYASIAWTLYLDDHDEKFPDKQMLAQSLQWCFGGKHGTSAASPPASARPLNRYLEIGDETSHNVQSFHCPYDRDKVEAFGLNDTCFDSYGTSYLLNPLILKNGAENPLTSFMAPLDRLYLEQCNWYCSPGHGGTGVTNWKAMVLFMNGHVAGPFDVDDYNESGESNLDGPVFTNPYDFK